MPSVLSNEVIVLAIAKWDPDFASVTSTLQQFVLFRRDCSEHNMCVHEGCDSVFFPHFTNRSANVPKKVSGEDRPLVALANIAKGTSCVVATCRLLTSFVLTDENMKTYAKKFKIAESYAALRKLVGAKSGASVSCSVVYNIIPKKRVELHDCKTRCGWGSCRLPTEYASLLSMQKRKLGNDDGNLEAVASTGHEKVSPDQNQHQQPLDNKVEVSEIKGELEEDEDDHLCGQKPLGEKALDDDDNLEDDQHAAHDSDMLAQDEQSHEVKNAGVASRSPSQCLAESQNVSTSDATIGDSAEPAPKRHCPEKVEEEAVPQLPQHDSANHGLVETIDKENVVPADEACLPSEVRHAK